MTSSAGSPMADDIVVLLEFCGTERADSFEEALPRRPDSTVLIVDPSPWGGDGFSSIETRIERLGDLMVQSEVRSAILIANCAGTVLLTGLARKLTSLAISVPLVIAVDPTKPDEETLEASIEEIASGLAVDAAVGKKVLETTRGWTGEDRLEAVDEVVSGWIYSFAIGSGMRGGARETFVGELRRRYMDWLSYVLAAIEFDGTAQVPEAHIFELRPNAKAPALFDTTTRITQHSYGNESSGLADPRVIADIRRLLGRFGHSDLWG
jgi:hypothetical protein